MFKSDEKNLCLELYCNYSPVSKNDDKYAIPSFISLFGECLNHSTTGYFGNDAYIILKAIDDLLIITMEYTYSLYPSEQKQSYCYSFYIDFTPNNQLHYAYLQPLHEDKFNRADRPTISNKNMAELLNYLSVSTWNEAMQDKGYEARFKIERDDSKITFHDTPCTITKYISEAFNLQRYLKTFTGSKQEILPYDIRIMAEKAKEKKRLEEEAARRRVEYLLKNQHLW